MLMLAGLAACQADAGQDSPIDPPAGEETGLVDTGGAPEDPPGATEGTEEEPQARVVGSCEYVSRFTQGPECRNYVGEGWSEDDVGADCSDQAGTLVLGRACSTEAMLGRCVIEQDATTRLEIVAYGDDTRACSEQKFGCETFGGGTWEPAAMCEDEPEGDWEGNVFIPPVLECVDPLPGEPPGNGPDGQVCTWQMISGSTEDGRNFEDYASCDVIRSQGRPYFPYPVPEDAERPDPRMDDPAYVEELEWVKSQIRASACVCCHSTNAPDGPSNWYLEQPGNFMNGFFDLGLTMGSHWVDSSAFGAFDPDDNNGFERVISGFPSVDGERMRDFFIGELEHRGLSPADFADQEPFGGPLYDQLVYEPTACAQGEGVARDGTITWTGGDARYVYVLEADATSPTTPPNLDLPEGTRWRIDVSHTDAPIESGSVTYGQTPARLTQRFPESGAPAGLQPGSTYYLYVSRDVIQPITRCLFTY